MAEYELDWTTGRLEMVRKCIKKNQKIMKILILDDFSKMMLDQLEIIARLKNNILMKKSMIFKQKIPARAPQLEARSGIGLSGGVHCVKFLRLHHN